MFDIDSGFSRYIWEGSYRDQPEWFIELLREAQNEAAKIRKAKLDKVRKNG